MAGVKDIRAAVESARAARAADGRPTLLFLDEVHRFNKAQQDTFLPYLEDGTLTFVGATTENPSFEVVSALLSRARVYVLKALSVEDLEALLRAALADEERGLGRERIEAEPEALELIAHAADGDARRALNMLELAVWAGAGRQHAARARRGARAAKSRAAATAASTRAGSSSTTRSRRCTRRCAAPIRTRRCTGCAACSMAAAIRSISRGAWCAWRSRTSGSPIRARSP